MKNLLTKTKKTAIALVVMIIGTMKKINVKANAMTEAQAVEALKDTALVGGTLSLFGALSLILVIIADVVGVFFIGYCIFQYMTGQEEMQAKHKKRGFVTLGAMIVISLLRATLPAILKIFGVEM